MRVFVYEHFCATPAVETSKSASLRAEGWAMLSAVLEDFARCPGVETTTLVDPGLAATAEAPGSRVVPPSPQTAEERTSFRSLSHDADHTLVIAPECGGILAALCHEVEEAGGRLLGPSSSAVRLTTDKLTMACHLNRCGIPTPPTWPATSPPSLPYPLVCKPRDGAGSQATFLLRDERQRCDVLHSAREEGWTGELILQPYLPGRAVSVAILAGEGRPFALPAAEQRLSTDGRFRYLGGRVPLPEDLDSRARRLAVRAAESIEGLRGYFGVDLVLGDAADGSADAVIEINPRLTTSYVGLRRLARFNVAGALLALLAGTPLPSWDWGTGPVVFHADERVVP